MREINILICENKLIYAEALRMMLSTYEDINVVEAICGGYNTIDYLKNNKCLLDLVLIDIKMHDMPDVEIIRQITRIDPHLPILVFSSYDNIDHIVKTIHAGVSGYLLKNQDIDDLVKAIRGTHLGEFHIDPQIAGDIINHMKQDNTPTLRDNIPPHLTERDIAILICLAKGFSNREIGDKLYLAEGTIKNYTSQLFKKIGAKDRLQAVIKAIEYGLTEIAS